MILKYDNIQMRRVQNMESMEDMSVSALEKELQYLKEQEKRYQKLSRKLKELETKSKHMHSQSEISEINEDKQIQNLKEEIEKYIMDIRKCEQEYRKMETQIEQSTKQLRILEEHYGKKQQENREFKRKIKDKGQVLKSKQENINRINRMREEYEEEIERLKEQVSGLEHEQIKYRKELEKVEFIKSQEEKQKNMLLETVTQYEEQIEDHYRKCECLKLQLYAQKERYNNLNEEINTLKEEEEELNKQIQIKQTQNQQIKTISTQNESKLLTIKQEIQIAENDIKILMEEFMRESELANFQEKENMETNIKYDNTCRETIQVWESIRQIIKIYGNKEVNNHEFQKLKLTAWQMWDQIREYLQGYLPMSNTN